MAQLTIENKIELLNLVDNNQISGIIAETGTGKSTTMMSWLVGSEYKVFNTQLTIPATNNLGAYQKSNLGDKIVGTACEGFIKYTNNKLNNLRNNIKSNENNATNNENTVANNNENNENTDTQLVYCTTGHMRKIFLDLYKCMGRRNIHKDDLLFCDVIVLDEAHLKTLDQEIIIRIYNLLLSLGFTMPRLILCSATLEIDENIPYIEIKGRKEKITFLYHNINYAPNDKSLYYDTVRVVLSKHRKTVIEEKGDTWLIFCAGGTEVEQIYDSLYSDDPTLEIFRAYASLSTEEISYIFDPPKPYTRKIIIATNIAETSITIENLTGIFDTLTEKVGETSTTGGLKLVLKHISKSSAKQRAGRTGRTCPGFVYRMCTQDFFHNFENQRVKEIHRVPLHTMMIELLSIGLHPKTLFTNVDRFDQTIKLLENLKLIVNFNNTPFVTEAGDFVSKMPLSVRGGTILYKWIHNEKNNIFPALCMVCMIECLGDNSFFYFPKKDRYTSYDEYEALCAAHYDRYFSKFASTTSIGSYLTMMNNFIGRNTDNKILFSSFVSEVLHKYSKIVDFSKKHSLNNKKFTEFLSLLRQAGNILENEIYVDTFEVNKFLKKIIPYYVQVYQDLILTKSGNGKVINYTNQRKSMTYNIFKARGDISVSVVDYDIIVGIITAEIDKGKKLMRFVSLYLPVNPDDLSVNPDDLSVNPEDLPEI